MRHQTKAVHVNPFWYKVRVTSRRLQANGKPEKDTLYVSGKSLHETKNEVELALGLDWFVKLKPIAYDDVVKEISGEWGGEVR